MKQHTKDIKKEIKPSEENEEVSEDRSGFNCEVCEGDGLVGVDRIGNPTICTKCAGTGKI